MPRMRRVVAIAVLLVLIVVAIAAINTYTEWLWFDSLGLASVYATVLWAQVGFFVAGAVAFFALLMANIQLAKRLAPRPARAGPSPEDEIWRYLAHLGGRAADRAVNIAVVLGGLFFALVMGSAASGGWETVLRYRNASPFGITDPLFHQDIGFYVFTLPFYRYLQWWLIAALAIVTVATAAVYLVRIYGFDLDLRRFRWSFSRAVNAHLAVLAASILLLFAWNYHLDTYELVYSTRGVVFGAGYTDVNATWPILQLLTILVTLLAVLVIVSIFRRMGRLLVVGATLWIFVALIVANLYPWAIQQWVVEPSELTTEEPYIVNNIRLTRQAYGLDKIEVRPFPAEQALTLDIVNANPQTTNNIRVWDYRPLLDTYDQIQTIRLYYGFHDVDIDRYTVDGRYVQVMLSARELLPERFAAEAQTWVNQRLQFTHGYGLVASPVNEVTSEGLPNLIVKDLPPQGRIPVTRPEIYYGEKTLNYVIVNTQVPEFDYPKGDENVYSSYQGTGGVYLNSIIRKLAYAWRFGDGNILLTNYLRPESRILYYRTIRERLERLAPFLLLDQDPYLVVADGKLYWIQDAYTHTDRYPYSESYGGQFNYIRNSIKAVIDAYDGSVKLYVVDPKDPIVATYAAIFPALFTPVEMMPASLRAHWRYPEGLFLVQSDMYSTYHMETARVFYNREDVWAFPYEKYADTQQQIEPYYVIMRLPGESREEFLLMLPFTPSNKNNMIAWLAARCDGERYGQMLVYKFPKDKVVFGPAQVEARIDQDTTISAQLTLWGQAGSRVIRGNLLVIPIEDSILYVEPIYLQAEHSRLPELKRVVLATAENTVMEPSLREAIASLFGKKPLPGEEALKPAPTTSGTQPARLGEPAAGETVDDLAGAALEHYNKAQEALKEGDWARYGEEQKALLETLKRLVELTSPSGE